MLKNVLQIIILKGIHFLSLLFFNVGLGIAELGAITDFCAAPMLCSSVISLDIFCHTSTINPGFTVNSPCFTQSLHSILDSCKVTYILILAFSA